MAGIIELWDLSGVELKPVLGGEEMDCIIESATIGGLRLGYSVHGEGLRKQPLLFAHGYGMRSTGALYAELLDQLSRQFVVYALDLPGHGALADVVEGWSYEAVADHVAAFSQKLSLKHPILVGHSFGAVVGLLAAIRHPYIFAAVCLLSPGPADARDDPVDTLDALIDHGHDRESLRAGFRKMFAREPGEKLDLVLDAVTLVDADVHSAQKRQNPHFSIDERLADVGSPALLVCGRDDVVVAPPRQHDMASKLKRSKEVVFSGEGHMLALERPDLAAREVIGFCDHLLPSAWNGPKLDLTA